MAKVNKTRKVVVQTEIESTYGTAPTFDAAADPVLIYTGFNPLQPQGDIFSPRQVRPSLSPITGTVGGKRYELALETILQGPEAIATDVPWRLGRALRACGLQETNVTATSFTYTPRSSAFESLAAEVYYEDETGGNALKHVMTGMYGSFQISSTAKAEVNITFNMQGLYAAPTVAAVISPTFETAKALAWQGVSGTFDNGSSRTPVIKSFTFDAGVDIQGRDDANAADGLIGFQIEGRQPTFEWVIERDTDIGVLEADWSAGTTHNITFDMVPGAAGNNVQFNAPAAWIDQAPQHVDVNGVRCVRLHYLLTGTDDEYTLTFT